VTQQDADTAKIIPCVYVVLSHVRKIMIVYNTTYISSVQVKGVCFLDVLNNVKNQDTKQEYAAENQETI
jgi:hypothetical protein